MVRPSTAPGQAVEEHPDLSLPPKQAASLFTRGLTSRFPAHRSRLFPMPLSPYKQAIARIYGARALSYDHSGENAAWHLGLCDTLLSRAALQEGEQVLDLATGTGTIALEAARRVGPNGRVVAVDLAPEMLAEAERKAAEQGLSDVIAFQLADAEDFRSELRFDHAFCCAALVWMSDMKQAIAHWHALLRPGGWLHLQTHSEDAFLASGVLAEAAAERGIELRFHRPFGGSSKLRAILAAAGFEAIDILEEPDHVECPVGQVLRNVPQKDSPFPGQEHSPLLNVGDQEWAAIEGETCARLEQQSTNGVILDSRTSLFARARRPALA